MIGRKLATAAGLTRNEWIWAARALPWLLGARICLAILGYRRTRDFLAPRPLGHTDSRASPSPARAAIVRGVDIAARNPPGSATCLPRALVLHRFLTQAGCPSQLHVGVRRSGEVLDGHAWVTVAGEPVGEVRGVPETYVPIRGAVR